MALMILYWTAFLVGFSLQVNGDFTVNIMHISSLQSNVDESPGPVGGMPRIIHFINESRKSRIPTLFFDTGDIFTGTLWYHVHKINALIPFYAILKPDAICLGDHELLDGVDMLKQFIDAVQVPFLCCNCDFGKEPKLRDVIVSHTIITIKRKKIGIVGYITSDAGLLTSNFANITLSNEVEAVTREVKKLQEEKINIIIVLGHAGWAVDKEVAEKVEGIDLIIGGHSATFLYTGNVPEKMENITRLGNYPLLMNSRAVPSVPYIHAYEKGLLVGKLVVNFDDDGIVTNMTGNPVLMDKTIAKNSRAVKILDGLRRQVEAHKNKVLGTSRADLNANCYPKECNFANLMTDSWIEYISEEYKGGDGWTDTPIALVTSGSFFPKDLNLKEKKGAVSVGDILAVSPYDNDVLKLSMKGSVLRKAIKHAVADGNLMEDKFLQYSGVRVRINYKNKPEERIESIRVRCSKCDIPSFSDLKDSENYQVAMQEYLAGGAINFTMFKDEAKQIGTVGMKQNQILEDYIRKYKMITPQEDERIVIIGDPPKAESEDKMSRKSDGNSRYLTNNKMVILISTLATLRF